MNVVEQLRVVVRLNVIIRLLNLRGPAAASAVGATAAHRSRVDHDQLLLLAFVGATDVDRRMLLAG